MNVTLQPTVLQWARRRAGLSEADLGKKLGITTDPAERVAQWERDGLLTYKRAEKLAEKTHTPFGYLFLQAPPEERLPVADFRTVGSSGGEQPPSPELLDVLFDAMRKQSWYRDYLIEMGEPRREFIGQARIEDAPEELAARISDTFRLGPSLRTEATSWEYGTDTDLRGSGGPGSVGLPAQRAAEGNPHRPLRLTEFRGFALSDPYAPLVFINSRDSQAAQMFTVIHELAHLWLGLSGVSNPEPAPKPTRRVELFCNAVAAEVLVPLVAAAFRRLYAQTERSEDPISILSRHFKVSSLVILRRMFGLRIIDWETFRRLHREEDKKFFARKAKQQEKGGGNYYATQQVRVGRRFALRPHRRRPGGPDALPRSIQPFLE